jgi:hypothetical protein
MREKEKVRKGGGKYKEIRKENEMRINTFECMLILNYFAIFLIL